MPIALITGITGQDGSYLAELLLSKDYEVHGIIRRSSSFNTGRIDHIFDKLHLHYGDMTDASLLVKLLQDIDPNEVYNLAAQSHVRVSFDIPEYTFDVVANGTLRLLEAIRQHNKQYNTDIKFYQASSSEMFGNAPCPQNEDTPFNPQSPYAVAKVAAFHMVNHYRDAYGIHANNGVLFNHESERRGKTFVTRKISLAAAKIKLGLQDKLFLGNLDAKRDWGHAADYVKAMYLMLQQEKPDNYVISTGETHSVRDFLDEAFGYLNLDWHKYVEIDPKYYRPAEVNVLCGDSRKVSRVLGWKPKITFKDLVRIMVEHDLASLK